MTLAILNVSGNTGYPQNDSHDSQVLDNTRFSIDLPREAHNKQWVLRSIKAHRVNTGKRLRWLEVGFPQLMEEERTHYQLEVADVDKGSVPLPSKSLRFYPNRSSMDQTQFDNTYEMISLTPHLNFGVHRLDSNTLDVIVKASANDGSSVGLTTLEIILEYM